MTIPQNDLSDLLRSQAQILDSGAAILNALADQISAAQQAPVDNPAPEPASAPAPEPAPAPQSALPGDIVALPRGNGTVYEYGDLFTYPAPNGWAPHADYSVNGQVIKKHYWGSRWYDGPFHIKNKVADLVAQKLLPSFNKAMTNVAVHLFAGDYDANGLPIRLPAPQPFVYQEPTYMGQSGDTPWLTILPEWMAAYMATEDASLAQSIEACARDLLILPIHVRDPKTGQPIDYRTYPAFSTYDNQENSMVTPSLRTGINGNTPDPNGLHYDVAHSPSLWFLPFLLTDDPLWLEEGQLQCSFAWSKDMPSPGHVGNLQVREMAWNMRDIIQTIIATRYAEAKGLLRPYHLPSQYFVDVMLKPTMQWFSQFYGDISPAGYAKIINSWGAPASYAPWQFDFLTTVIGWGVWSGVSELQPLFDWLAKGLLERLTGAQGWNANCFTFYYLGAPTEDWASSFKNLVVQEPRAADVIPAGQTFIPMLSNDYCDYVCWTAAAARMGKLIGNAQLASMSRILDTKIKSSGIAVNFRHTIGG